MLINYFTGPGLARLYWLELLAQTGNAGKRHNQEPRPGCGRTLLAWILRGLGKRMLSLGERLAPRTEPSAPQSSA
jgi:hypothetical protein